MGLLFHDRPRVYQERHERSIDLLGGSHPTRGFFLGPLESPSADYGVVCLAVHSRSWLAKSAVASLGFNAPGTEGYLDICGISCRWTASSNGTE